MDNFAVADDVEIRMMRDLTDAETAVVEVLLDEVSAMMRLRVPDLDTRVIVDTNLGVVARSIAAEAVRRVLTNPDGWREVAIDDFRRVRDAAVSSGALYLSDLDWLQLRVSGDRVRSVRLVAYDDA